MLSPDSRQVLLDALCPDPGDELDAAVTTTFTLSLTAALVPALAFSSLRLRDDRVDPLVILEAIRSVADRTDIFCQAGSIHVPKSPPDILAFLEPMIHQVTPPHGGLFHPKIWFLRFRKPDGECTHRLLVLSRNLTTDATWDVVLRLDQESLSEADRPENEALAQLLESLPGMVVRDLAPERRERVRSLAQAARRVIWERPADVESLRFSRPADIDWKAGRALVISPFVNSGGLDVIAPQRSSVVVARADQLDRLPVETVGRFRDRILVLNPTAGASVLEDEADTPATPNGLLAELHAKVYVLEPSKQWGTARVLVGSANATSSALTANTELLVEMTGKRNRLGIDALVGPEAPLFKYLEAHQPAGDVEPPEDEKIQHALENWLRSVATRPHTVTVIATHEGVHTLDVTASDYPERPAPENLGGKPMSVTIGLLTRRILDQPWDGPGPLSVTFEQVPTPDVTPYVTITAEVGEVRAETVVVAELVGDPVDRLDLVLARQIDTPEKLMRLIRLLLDFANPAAFANFQAAESAWAWAGGAAGSSSGGELELVLHALAHHPASLKSVDDLITRLEKTSEGREVLDESFVAFWRQVRAALKKITKGRGKGK